MKIERIDDNSIRCTLTSLDLSSRNINLRDMTYGSEAAKRLFTEMMQKAQNEVGFTADSGPLMIEAVPLQGGSIQLVISKIDDPEELDTRFSKFTAAAPGSQNGWISQLASEILEGAHGLLQDMKDKASQQANALEGDSGKTVGSEADTSEDAGSRDTDIYRIYVFQSLDRVIDAATAIGDIYDGPNTLYKDTKDHHFYLVLHAGKGGVNALNRAANLLSEYGSKLKDNDLYEAYFTEHYELFLKENALQKLRSI
mgnify:FL=1